MIFYKKKYISCKNLIISQKELLFSSKTYLESISGFSGSSGLGFISGNNKILFVDGRYIIQAKLESAFDVHHIMEINEILSSKFSQEVIFFDPWAHFIYEVKNWNFTKKPLIEINLEDHLVDLDEEYFHYPIEFSGKSFIEKLNDVKEENSRLLTDPNSISWLLNIRNKKFNSINGFTPNIFAYLLILNNQVDGNTSNQNILFCKKNNLTKNFTDTDFTDIYKDITFVDFSEMPKFLSSIDQEILIDFNTTPYAFLDILQNPKFSNDPFLLKSSIRNETEKKGIYDAHKYDGVALIKFFYWLEKNWNDLSEIDASKKLDEFRSKNPMYMGNSFETISASGPNAAIIHYNTIKNGKRILSNGDIYLLDSGGQYLNGTTDITRTIFITKDSDYTPTQRQKKDFTIVLKAHMAIARAIFPKGTLGIHIDSLARQFLWSDYLDYDHGTGHGVGHFLGVHDGPCRISKNCNVQIMENMVLSNEPGIYREGKWGIRLESLMMVRECKKNNNWLYFDTLSLVPFDISLIDFEILDKLEKEWLKNYHERILNVIGKDLEQFEVEWFKEKFLLFK